jgi:hypothetical protein
LNAPDLVFCLPQSVVNQPSRSYRFLNTLLSRAFASLERVEALHRFSSEPDFPVFLAGTRRLLCNWQILTSKWITKGRAKEEIKYKDCPATLDAIQTEFEAREDTTTKLTESDLYGEVGLGKLPPSGKGPRRAQRRVSIITLPGRSDRIPGRRR